MDDFENHWVLYFDTSLLSKLVGLLHSGWQHHQKNLNHLFEADSSPKKHFLSTF